MHNLNIALKIYDFSSSWKVLISAVVKYFLFSISVQVKILKISFSVHNC